MSTDEAIVDAIRTKLVSDPRIRHPTEIAISAHGGMVTLRGTVRSLHQRLVAAELASSVPGVVEIEDVLHVDPRDRWDEDVIRGSALQELMSRTDVPADRVDVTVKDGRLILTGEVEHQSDRDAAVAAVSDVAGVREVTDEITIAHGA